MGNIQKSLKRTGSEKVSLDVDGMLFPVLVGC